MYKVIIVDDEPNIREGLMTLINWEKYGFDVVATATNGEEGMEAYKRERPDLLIVDIRMPKMDGLSMISKIREIDTSTHFIILSGYAEFNYAKKAMQSKVDGYILKPLDEDELIEMLESVKDKLKKSHELQEFAQFENEKIKDYFIDQLISNVNIHEDREIINFIQKYQLADARLQIMLIKGMMNGTWSPPLEKWKLKLIEKYESNKMGLVFSRKDVIGILLIKRPHEKQGIQALYNNLIEILDSDKFIATLGEESYELSKMHQSYITASQLMSQHFYFEKNTIISKRNHHYRESTHIHAHKEFRSNEYEQKLQYALEIADNEICEKIISSFMDEMGKRLFSPQLIKLNAIQIFTNAVNGFLGLNPKYKKSSIPFMLETSVEIYQMESLPKIKKYLLANIHEILDIIDDGNTEIPIKKIVNLINNHYAENLRLETLAEVFNYNSAYLGKLFKNYTGKYFNTYIDHVRIERAKALLLEGLKVYEVAEQVGYGNVDYFHKKFRQYVGIAPSKYRKKANMK